MAKEGQSNTDTPSNDEVVNGLVKDFDESCKTDSKTNIDGESGAGPSRTVEENEPVEEDSKEKAEDYVDEEEMKQKELTYSDEDRERLRKEAEEHKQKGNGHFKNNEYKESIDCYTLGLRTCPLAYLKERAILYANRAAAKIKMNDDEPALEDCSKAIELDPMYVRVVLRRAQLQESMEKLDEALVDFKKLLELDPANRDAIVACQRLPPLIHEKNEKMKTEMMGQLKNLGNILLKPFGMSTDNFQMVQDPNTGSYSVSFQQKS